MASIGLLERVANRYRVLEELGGGGMGVVYRARDELEGRDVALKVIRTAARWDVARRLRREARAANALDSSRVARVYDVGETPDGELYLVMEYVPGSTLRALLRRGRPARREAIRIIHEVAAALGEAHRAGLVHRDVKPENVMVGEHPEQRVVLLDFGIVKDIRGGDGANASTELTHEGTVIGTPAYLAPEQALGQEVGPEVDQFALGVTAFELLTGTLPWRKTEMTGMLAQVLSATPPAASDVEGSLPPVFDGILWRALAKEKRARFPTIEAFADALEAAERGDYTPPPALDNAAAPASQGTGSGVAQTGLEVPRPRGRWLAAALGLLALGGGATSLVAAERSRGAAATVAVMPPLNALATPDAKIACPLFEAHGVPELEGSLGAAAASFACERVKWYRGGRDDRILPAAALLDLPTEPVDGFRDPYLDPATRARTITLARERANAYLDGAVTRDMDGWLVTITLRSADGREIARGQGRAPKELPPAVKLAVENVWKNPPLTIPPIDPGVARWTLLPDVEMGLVATDLQQLHRPKASCDLISRRGAELGIAYFRLAYACEDLGPDGAVDAGLPAIDESSPASLAASVHAVTDWDVPLSTAEARRLVTKLQDLRAHETSRLGLGLLADAEGRLWASINESHLAHVAFLAATSADPLLLDDWQEVVLTSSGVGSVSEVSALAAAWYPTEAAFLPDTGSARGDKLEERLHETRLAYVIEPGRASAMNLGRTLAEAGHADEARAIAAASLGKPEADEMLQDLVLDFIDLHDARFAEALSRLSAGIGTAPLVTLARILGVMDDVSAKWAARFLSEPGEKAEAALAGNVAPITLCMSSGRDLSSRCLDRITTLAHATRNWWGEGGEAFLEGAKLYARGDLRGAVTRWRPLVIGPTDDIVRMLPTEAFERAGEPDLAARLDARKMSFTFVAGVSDAAPREAKHALAAGDRARAKELAQKVVTAWEVADATVPAVAEMKGLLKQISSSP